MSALDMIVTHGALIIGIFSFLLAFYTLKVSANKRAVEKLQEKLDREIQERLADYTAILEEISKLKERK